MENTKEFKKILKKYQENYHFIYENEDKVAGFSEAKEAFKSFYDTHLDFISQFLHYQQDLIIRDREQAAFMFTMEDLGYLE